MMKKGIFILGVIGLVISSCIKHEVVPAPVPQADLYCHFAGNIGGDSTEFTQNVSYYDGFAGLNYEENFGIASAKYYFNMQSTTQVEAIGVMLGSITWSVASGNGAPALGTFNEFFLDNDLPPYTMDANNGFQVLYTDVSGNLWNSVDTVPSNQSVEFTNIVQESDEAGDYSKFKCSFDTKVYRRWWDNTILPSGDWVYDSISITNAELIGWFER